MLKAILLYHQGADILPDESDDYLSKHYSIENRIKGYMSPKWAIVVTDWDQLNRPTVMTKYSLTGSKVHKIIYDNIVDGRRPFNGISYDHSQFDNPLGAYKFHYVGNSSLVDKITTYYFDVDCNSSSNCSLPEGINNPVPNVYYTQSFVYKTEFDDIKRESETTYYRTNYSQDLDKPKEIPFYKERLTFTFKGNPDKQLGYSIISGLNNGAASYDVPYIDYGYKYIESNYEQLPSFDLFQLGYVDLGGASDYLHDITYASILSAELDENYRDKGLSAIEALTNYISKREMELMAGALNTIN